ncbi:hypothetical protein D3C72_2193220 [compost metagenome]
MLSKLSANRRTIRFWSAVGTVAVLIALIVLSPPFKGFAEQAMAWAQATIEQHPGAGALVFFLFCGRKPGNRP